QPLVAQQVDVTQVPEAVVGERVEEARDGPGARVARELTDEPEHRQPGQGKRGDEDRVVNQDRPAAGEADRPGERDQAEEVLRVGERPPVRMEDRRVEELTRGVTERVEVPREDPGREERIPEVAHGGAEPWD